MVYTEQNLIDAFAAVTPYGLIQVPGGLLNITGASKIRLPAGVWEARIESAAHIVFAKAGGGFQFDRFDGWLTGLDVTGKGLAGDLVTLGTGADGLGANARIDGLRGSRAKPGTAVLTLDGQQNTHVSRLEVTNNAGADGVHCWNKTKTTLFDGFPHVSTCRYGFWFDSFDQDPGEHELTAHQSIDHLLAEHCEQVIRLGSALDLQVRYAQVSASMTGDGPLIHCVAGGAGTGPRTIQVGGCDYDGPGLIITSEVPVTVHDLGENTPPLAGRVGPLVTLD